MQDFSNETIYALLIQKFKENDKKHNELIAHAEKTNGNVMRNTAFRLKAGGGFVVIGFIGASILYKLFL